MKRPTRILIGTIALLAMAWVHVMKPVRGFECEHDGAHRFTLQDHCHGPHSAACHDHDDEEPCHSHDDLPAGDDTEHHKALVESLPALKVDSFQFAAVLAVTPLIIEAIALPPVVSAGESVPRHMAAHPDGRRWPRILSHCIALMI
ncbi:MAG: hypothetical protein R3F13_20890 [Prosthecobacter sp.]